MLLEKLVDEAAKRGLFRVYFEALVYPAVS